MKYIKNYATNEEYESDIMNKVHPFVCHVDSDRIVHYAEKEIKLELVDLSDTTCIPNSEVANYNGFIPDNGKNGVVKVNANNRALWEAKMKLPSTWRFETV